MLKTGNSTLEIGWFVDRVTPDSSQQAESIKKATIRQFSGMKRDIARLHLLSLERYAKAGA
jgi:hypothetical protein